MKRQPSLTLVLILAVIATWVRISAARGPERGFRDVHGSRIHNRDGANMPLRTHASALAQRDEDQPQAQAAKQTAGEKKPPAVAPADVDKKARAALDGMREFLTSQDSIRAQIKESVAIGERRFVATGRYMKSKGLKLRLEFQLRAGNTDGTLLEVCDGQVLWTRYKIGDTERITRRDVVQILKEAATVRSAPQSILMAEMGLGGLPSLIASLERSMTFTSMTEETVSDRPLTLIQGRWNTEYRTQLAGRDAAPSSTLPAFVPDIVRIYIDNMSQFPRRIAYLKRNGNGDNYRHMVTLDFSNVELNAPIDNSEFLFVPPDKPVPENITQDYLMMLRQSGRTNKSAAPSGALPERDAREAD